LLVLTDGAGRCAGRRNAWQRLVRVIDHEMNNSSPDQMITGGLESLIRKDPTG
jgi:hypothetical protein